MLLDYKLWGWDPAICVSSPPGDSDSVHPCLSPKTVKTRDTHLPSFVPGYSPCSQLFVQCRYGHYRFLRLVFAWRILSHPLTLTCVFILELGFSTLEDNTVGSCFLIQPGKLCLLLGSVEVIYFLRSYHTVGLKSTILLFDFCLSPYFSFFFLSPFELMEYTLVFHFISNIGFYSLSFSLSYGSRVYNKHLKFTTVYLLIPLHYLFTIRFYNSMLPFLFFQALNYFCHIFLLCT